MKEKTNEKLEASLQSEASGTGSLLTGKISRRAFGKLLGMQAALASSVTLSGCLGGGGGSDDPAPDPGTQVLSRAAFVATISDYFNWVHSSEYIDAYKSVQPTFIDVIVGATPYAKQIETALEESIISNSQGYFYPTESITREDAADIYVKAFKIPAATGNPLSGFTDAATISASKLNSVKAIVEAGYMSGTSTTLFSPKGTLTANEAKAILDKITSSRVAPPQVMCKSGTTAPRRYVEISTPTAGATIYYSYTYDGSEPVTPDPANVSTSTTYTKTSTWSYNFRENGVLQFVNPLNSTTDSRLYRLKAVAVKNGMVTSAVQEFMWNIVRPNVGAFQAKLVHAGTSNSPTVWKIHNPAEYYQAHVFYIEGSTGGVVFDAGEYGYQKANMKTFIDTIATKPYVMVLGHNHPDHAEQVYNFTSAGITLYTSEIEKASLAASSRTDFQAAAAAATVINDGQSLDLGNVQVTLFIAPGHTNGLLTLLINQTGWVYASDHFGCNRAYTADTTQYNLTKVDIQLSLSQQLVSNYKKKSTSGLLNEVTNAHQEIAVGMEGVNNFLKCFQQIIDEGDAIIEPSIRGGISGNSTSPFTKGSRMTKIGDMWRDKNWMAIGNALGGNWGTAINYLTAPTTAYPCGATIDYNATDGHKKYSVLSNVEISGGNLVGVDVYWAAPSNGVPNKLSNKFDPWTYAYTINVATGTSSITFKPTAMSNKITSMKVNGTTIKQGSSVTLSVSAGSKITVDIVAPDGVTTSTYVFTVAMV